MPFISPPVRPQAAELPPVLERRLSASPIKVVTSSAEGSTLHQDLVNEHPRSPKTGHKRKSNQGTVEAERTRSPLLRSRMSQLLKQQRRNCAQHLPSPLLIALVEPSVPLRVARAGDSMDGFVLCEQQTSGGSQPAGFHEKQTSRRCEAAEISEQHINSASRREQEPITGSQPVGKSDRQSGSGCQLVGISASPKLIEMDVSSPQPATSKTAPASPRRAVLAAVRRVPGKKIGFGLTHRILWDRLHETESS